MCPDYKLICPEETKETMVLLPQWCTKMCDIKKKKINSLFNLPMKLDDIVKKYNETIRGLAGHIYRASRQWEAFKVSSKSLKVGHVLMVVDYQQNGSVLHRDATTSSHMGANTSHFAIYPVYLEVGLPGETVACGGIIWLSSDLKHDREQVLRFQEGTLEFVRQKFGLEVVTVERWSDRCGAQFLSQFAVHDLYTNLPGICVHWNYYEAGEGKNQSDLLGALFKLAYIRGVACSQDFTPSAHNIQEVIEIARPRLTNSGNKFEFIEMKELDTFERMAKNQRKGVSIPQIMKQHHITRTADGQLYSRELSCKGCLEVKFKMCDQCIKLKPVEVTVTMGSNENPLQEEEEESAMLEVEGATQGDGRASDNSEDESDLSSDSEEFGPGSIVWARVRRWHPAQIVMPHDLPKSYSHLAAKCPKTSVIVKRFVINDYLLLPVTRLDHLGTNTIDRERASKTVEIRDAWDMAVSVLREDF